MVWKSTGVLALSFALAMGLAACGDAGDGEAEDAATPTPQENISPAEPAGVGGTTNQ